MAKVVRARQRSANGRADAADTFDPLFALLGDTTRAPDDLLPATGVPLEWERLLSAPFIVAEGHGYGTRCSTVLAIGRDGGGRFIERTFDPAGRPIGEADYAFVVDPAA